MRDPIIDDALQPRVTSCGRDAAVVPHDTMKILLVDTTAIHPATTVGAGAATFCTTVVAAAAMADDPTLCEGGGGAGADASGDMITIPSNIGGVPTSVQAKHATMSAVSSNTLWEDRCIIQDGDAGEMYFAVLDGHGGWDCAEFAYPLLPAFIAQSLSKGVSSGNVDVEASITEGFITVEAMWVKRLKSEWLRDPNYVTYGQPGTERLSSGKPPALLPSIFS